LSKLLWHSNAPWSPTGYGQQTALFAPMLNEKYEMAISSFYGLEGAPRSWEKIPVFPGLGGEYGNDTLPQHAAQWFGGDPRGGLVVTLMDVWVLDPAMPRQLNCACWVPVDHNPAPPKVIEFFVQSDAVPIAMSRFGELQLGRLDPLYVPHGVDTTIYKPMDTSSAREKSFPKDAFVVGMVAANKGRPSRKGFPQALRAFAEFAKHHDNAYLYLHTQFDPNVGGGENIPALIEHLGIPTDRVRQADQYAMLHVPYTDDQMARIFGAMDVLLNCSWGEGFGIPVLEAQSCGVPAIVTDFTAMTEVCGAGWKVKHTPYWTALNSWQAIPDSDDVLSALEECYSLTSSQRQKLSNAARQHALAYDSRLVLKQYMLPALRIAQQRFDARGAVRIPARLKTAA
jgi:glycosyltransferase involved in cell wall biosynthesis